jgi:hypothetical protein
MLIFLKHMDSIYNILYSFIKKYYKYSQEKTYEILINLILVNEDVRPGYLIQYIDYDECIVKHPSSSKTFVDSLLKVINELFPNLIQSVNYEHNQGIIISKTDYNGVSGINNKLMGKILGYPCFNDFDDLVGNKTEHYIIDIYVLLGDYKIQIIANKCKNKNTSEFDVISSKAQDVLRKKKYNNIFINKVFVIVEVIKNITTQSIITKLSKNKKITKSNKKMILNTLYNFGFDDNLITYFEEGGFQYHNPVHRGLLIGLLITEKNDRIDPFCPIPDSAVKEFDEITKKWSSDLKNVLIKTSEL